MLERRLIQILREGIAGLTAQPRLINVLFETNEGLTSAEAAVVRELFLANPPEVVFQYPKKDAKFPLIAVILGKEGQSDPRATHDFGGFVDGFSDLEGLANLTGTGIKARSEIKTSLWSRDFHIFVYARHPDQTLYTYSLVKYMLLTRLRDILAEGVHSNILMGTDMGPDMSYEPDVMFVRRLTLSVVQAQSAIAFPWDEVRRVVGPFIQDEDPNHGTSSAGVTPYIP